MNRLRSVETRRRAAAISTGVLAPIILAGCDLGLSSPDLKPETKAKLEHILKPAAVKAARKLIRFSKSHDSVYSYVSRDEDTPNGYDISVEGLKPDSPRIEAYMLGNKEKWKVVLKPETTYYIFDMDSTPLGRGDVANFQGTISSTEEPPHKRKVWYALGYSDEEHNGKTDEKSQTFADTHVYSPDDKEEVASALEYARSVAEGFPAEVAVYLAEIALETK